MEGRNKIDNATKALEKLKEHPFLQGLGEDEKLEELDHIDELKLHLYMDEFKLRMDLLEREIELWKDLEDIGKKHNNITTFIAGAFFGHEEMENVIQDQIQHKTEMVYFVKVEMKKLRGSLIDLMIL